MKRVITLFIIIAVILGSGYYGLRQYAPEVLEEYLPFGESIVKTSSTNNAVDTRAHKDILIRNTTTKPETATEFCIRQKGSVRKHGGGDTKVKDVCFINDGKDGVLCDLQLFFKRECGKSVINENAISTQQAFIESRGIPGVYMIYFSDTKFDENKKPVARDYISRVESWTFGNPTNKTSNFQNNFFTDEEDLDDSILLMNHNINPLWFKETTTVKDVTGLLGKADCEVTEEAGVHTIRTLKYEETATKPVVSVSFSEDQIIAATVGIAFKSDYTSDTLCP